MFRKTFFLIPVYVLVIVSTTLAQENSDNLNEITTESSAQTAPEKLDSFSVERLGSTGASFRGSSSLAQDVFAKGDSVNVEVHQGSFTYSYTIKTPPGTNGLSPSISLVYNSSMGNGPLGMGWRIDGLSVIERDPAYPINFNNNDHYIFMGSKLILTEDYGSEKRFHTERENYLKIIGYNLNSQNLDSYWEITFKNGTKMLYGYDPFHHTSATDGFIKTVGNNVARIWALCKVEDAYGNYYLINYHEDETSGDYYPVKITYTLNDSISPSIAERTVDFFYENRTGDAYIKHIPAFVIMDKRLKWISIKAGENLIRKYRLDYEDGDATKKSRLTAIQEYGDDGNEPEYNLQDEPCVSSSYVATGDTLPEATFKWQDVPVEKVFYEIWNGQVAPDAWPYRHKFMPMDVDGDGKTDIVEMHINGSTPFARVWISNGTSFDQVWNGYVVINSWPYVNRFMSMDVQGDGRDDIVEIHKNGSTPFARVWRWNGTKYYQAWNGYVAINTWPYSKDFLPVDVDGDGKCDIVEIHKNGSTPFARVWNSDGTGFHQSWNGYVQINSWLLYEGDPVYYPLDINGDGYGDIVEIYHRKDDEGKAYAIVWLSNGYGFDLGSHGPVWTSTWNGSSTYEVVDFNGDGRSDLLEYWVEDQTKKVRMWRGTGRGFEPGWCGNLMPDGLLYDAKYRTADVNGDFRTDIVEFYVNGSTQFVRVWLSDGSQFYERSKSYVSQNNYNAESEFYPMDINGDAKGDVVEMYPYDYSPYDLTYTRVWLTPGLVPDLLSDYQNVEGSSATVAYQTAPRFDNAVIPSSLSGSDYDIVSDSGRRKLVRQITYEDGLGLTSTRTFDYYNGLKVSVSPSQQVFLGFEWIKEIDAFGKYTKTYCNQTGRYYRNLVDKLETYGNDGKLYTKVENQYDSRTDDQNHPEIQFIHKTNKWNYDYNGDEQSDPIVYRTEYTEYDDHGHLTRKVNHGDTSVAADDTAVFTDYAKNLSTYVFAPSLVKSYGFDLEGNGFDPGLIGESYNTGLASLTKYYFYDDNQTGPLPLGTIESKSWIAKNEGYYNQSEFITISYEYDNVGNMIKLKDGRANAGEYSGYTQQLTYDDQYRTLVTSKINALTQTEQYIYDEQMHIKERIDVNDVSLYTEYDAFGRVSEETLPLDYTNYPSSYDATRKYTYVDVVLDQDGNISTPGYIKTERHEENGNYFESYTHFDGFGREIQHKQESENLNEWIAIDYHYDELRRNYKSSVPYVSSISTFDSSERESADRVFTQKLYDEVGRLSKTIHTDTTENAVVYQKNTAIFLDPNGHVTATKISGNERYEYSYEGQYTYDGLKAGFNVGAGYYTKTTIKEARDGAMITDTSGNEIETTLDMLGQRTAYSDPDIGDWSYTYDANGNLKSQTDAESQTIQFEYDELDRVTKKDYPAGDDTLYYYDESGHGESKGRLTRIALFDGASEEDEQSLVYDERGRITSAAKTINGFSKTLQTAYDSMDRVTQETYPGAVETISYTYNSGGNLETLSGADSYVTGVDYTPLGKISGLSYGNGVVTSYDYYDTDTEYDGTSGTYFSYRLKSIVIDKNPTYQANLDYEYDKKDNVMLKDFDDGTQVYTESYSYDELDRLVSADSTALYGYKTYAYDVLNNITLKDGRSYTYNHPTKPRVVMNDGQYSYTYDNNGNMLTRSDGRTIAYNYDNRITSISDGGTYNYDANGQRELKVENGVTTYYFFPQYEEEHEAGQPVNVLKYYFANGKRVAKRSTGEGLVYFHSDHLSSSVRVTDSNGAVVKSIAYKPYGTDAAVSGSVSIKHKFTDQEQDSATGLYYYNARYYDPELGRFIQPDPLLDGNNWYAYCNNNPVRYTDPTGHYPLEDYATVLPKDNPDAEAPEPPPIDPIARAEDLLGIPYGSSYEGASGGNVTITEPPKNVDCTELVAYAHNKPIYRTSEFNEDNPHYKKVNTTKRGDVKVWRYTTPKGKRKGHAALITGESGDRAILHVDTIGVRYSSDYIKGEYKSEKYTNITIEYYRPRG